MPLLDAVPPDVEVLGVTLPGRDRRLAEPPILDAEPLVEGVAAALATMRILPTAFLGHSLGAAAAVTVALAAPASCGSLVVSAQLPAGTPIERHVPDTDEQLIRLLVDGGTPPEVLADEAWQAHVLALLRADLRLGARLAAHNAGRSLAGPVWVVGGADDRLVPSSELTRWRSVAPAGVIESLLPGGHFALLAAASRPMVATLIADALAAATDAALPTSVAVADATSR